MSGCAGGGKVFNGIFPMLQGETDEGKLEEKKNTSTMLLLFVDAELRRWALPILNSLYNITLD